MKPFLTVIILLFVLIGNAQKENSFDKSYYRERAYKNLFFTMTKEEANLVISEMAQGETIINFGENLVFEIYDPLIDKKFGLYEVPFYLGNIPQSDIVSNLRHIEILLNEKDNYSQFIRNDYTSPDFFKNITENSGIIPYKFALDEENKASKILQVVVYKGEKENSYDLFFAIRSLKIQTFINLEKKDLEKEKILNNLDF